LEQADRAWVAEVVATIAEIQLVLDRAILCKLLVHCNAEAQGVLIDCVTRTHPMEACRTTVGARD
jgi:hypothetical protein